jgi:hypothetical protein
MPRIARDVKDTALHVSEWRILRSPLDVEMTTRKPFSTHVALMPEQRVCFNCEPLLSVKIFTHSQTSRLRLPESRNTHYQLGIAGNPWCLEGPTRCIDTIHRTDPTTA